MFLTVHETAAIILTQSIHQPLPAFIIGIVSHYVLDSIPHGDDFILSHLKGTKKYAIALSSIGAIDMAIALSWFWFLYLSGKTAVVPIAVAAVAGGMLPDILSGVYLFTHYRWLEWNYRLNSRLHTLWIKKPLPAAQGYLIQGIFFIVLIGYLFAR